MDQLLLLTWARGTGLNLALTVFVLGVVWRLIEIYSLGRKQDLSAPRDVPGASGWHTIFRRSVPPPGMLKASPVSYIGGYVFHAGLAVVIFLFAPHSLRPAKMVARQPALRPQSAALPEARRSPAAIGKAQPSEGRWPPGR